MCLGFCRRREGRAGGGEGEEGEEGVWDARTDQGDSARGTPAAEPPPL